MTVVIATRNRPVALRRCLEAILAGTVLPDTILVVDQSDGAATAEVVTDLAARGAAVGIRHIASPRDVVGMAAAQNLAFANVRTPLVAVTDDDCIPDAAWIATAAHAFEVDPSLGLLTGRVLPGPVVGEARHAVAARTDERPSELDAGRAPWEVGSGNNMVFALDVLRRTGGNDERLGPGAPLRGGADMDLFRRALRAGARGRYEPALVVQHDRATRAERLGRRIPYGYGLGVAAALWWRQGDRHAHALLGRWATMRLRRLARGVRHHPHLLAWEEVLVLVGTARGVGRGLVVRPGEPLQEAGR